MASVRYWSLGIGILLLVLSTFTPLASAANHPPKIDDVQGLKTKVGEHFVYQLYGSDPDPEDASNLTWGVSQPQPGLTVSKTGLLEWTPTDFYAGYQTVLVTLSDGKATSVKTLLITVEKADKKDGNSAIIMMLQQAGLIAFFIFIIILSIFWRMKFGWRRRGLLWFLLDRKE